MHVFWLLWHQGALPTLSSPPKNVYCSSVYGFINGDADALDSSFFPVIRQMLSVMTCYNYKVARYRQLCIGCAITNFCGVEFLPCKQYFCCKMFYIIVCKH